LKGFFGAGRVEEILHHRWADGVAARFREEEPEDPGQGTHSGPETHEEGDIMKKGSIGSSFDEFLKEEGIFEEVEAAAIKRVLSWQLQQAMEAAHISKTEMARRMRTSRSHLDRLLDPDNERVQLDTLMKAATAVGKRVRIELENHPA
jgi:predicted XRE-type DNA-binding protein